MSVVAPKFFSNSDTGAPSSSGTVGSLIEVLSSCLILRKMFTAVSGGSFVDNTTQARLEGGTAFTLFQGPTASNDEAYFGLCRPFDRVKITFATPGVHNAAVTLVWEYWNGSAWTSFTPTSDSLGGLTSSGAIKFGSLSGWATTTVNSQAAYWIRLRFTAGSWTTNPTVDCCTLVGWQEAASGTNTRTYRQGGSLTYFWFVNDNGSGSEGARETSITGYEVVGGTAIMPATPVWTRKSQNLNGTANPWWVLADDRTAYFSTDDVSASPSRYNGTFMGEFYSYMGSADLWRIGLIGAGNETQGQWNSDVNKGCKLCVVGGTSGFNSSAPTYGTTVSTRFGTYLARSYTGIGSYLIGNKVTNRVFTGWANLEQDGTNYARVAGSGNHVITAGLKWPNLANGKFYFCPSWLLEPTPRVLRGKLRGFWFPCGSFGVAAHGDEFDGVGDLAGRRFKIVTENGGNRAHYALEISDTWETN